MTDNRSSSALFKRAEQLKRWEESDTNKQSPTPRRASRIQFSSGIVFLAACTAGDKDEVQRLLKRGADINTANVDGLTALHQACIDDNLDMVEFLVTHGADVNRGDNEGWTPLHATASCGFVSIARYLLENGADVAAVNYDGELPVDIAESDAMGDMLQKIIDEKGVDCEKSRNAEVDTLLSDARNWAANGYVEVRDMNGGTPLHVAAAKGYIDVAKTLLEECSADPDCVDYEGWTPLHAAALWGQKEAAALLLKFGADPHIKNYSGQTCLDLVDPGMSSWLTEAMNAQRRMNNNNNKRKRSPPQHDSKRVDIEITPQQPEKVVNDKPPASPEIIKTEGKPPRGRPPSPDTTETESSPEDAPSWRRSASFRNRQPDPPRDNNKAANNAVDNDTILRRTHSFENDKSFYQRYRDVTARIKASSCPSIPPAQPAAERKKPQEHTNNATESTNDDIETRINPTDRREREVNTWSGATTTTPSASPTNTTTTTTVRSSSESVESNSSNSTPSSATPTKLSPGNIFKNFFKSFVPPVRDEESETQRKAHAKRVRETRRSTQGVTLDEIKSAEQLVKKKAGNGTTESPPPVTIKKEEPSPVASPAPDNGSARASVPGGDVAVSLALACASATATATIAANSERRPSWRLRLDPTNKFELEDAGRSSPRSTAAAEATVTLPFRRPPTGSTANTTANTTTVIKDENRTSTDTAGEEEKERESSTESKSSSNASPASTQAALNVIQRRRRPKRRSTGVGHVDMDDIVNDRGGGGEGCEADNEAPASGSERTEEGEEKDYKALYEASQSEVRRLRALLATSEQQLREARATITRLTQVNQNSLSEIEKREKRAMERKLSEMEEELKQLQKLKAENERLRAENRALTRVVSKLTNSAAK
ncbi:protein phosphatase 1 regulatory subunit 12B isoform X2 [Helicoverpa armigera]|uniref:protein phosphatase 1 regulatory subunit 12B isoform X2 n=1 Tax=Helicoverpa armigera TaxID=29058 RepID=UPI000B38CA7A|nr:protein phosphatase 1 regulatory subunit 12B isoform X2 [Helicoverpa armigera]XP_047040308.1 protein phosphatase 1 regulatory subunit 12B isoform X2 [Helicoverpa zea]